jgi:glutaredoxin 3
MQLLNYTIFSTPTCHYCHLLKDWLSQNGIAYDYKDVAMDLVARQEMVTKSEQMGVPVSILRFQDGEQIIEKVVIGYDQPQIASLLNITA